MVDLTRPLEEDGSIEIVTPGSDEALEVLRHSTAHLMALSQNVYMGMLSLSWPCYRRWILL